ncbi:MAG: hypothetical protein R3F49_15970 [Planctomycetota bacterium]
MQLPTAAGVGLAVHGDLALVATPGGGALLIDLARGAREAVPFAAQDATGRVWLGARAGVVELRGNRLVTFAPAPAQAPSLCEGARERALGARVTAFVYDDAQERLLCGTYVGNLIAAAAPSARLEQIGQIHSSAVTAILPLTTSARVATACEGGEVRIGDARLSTDGQPGIMEGRASPA